MGSAIVIWNQSNVAALRQVDWASVPMDVSGRLLNRMFNELPRGSDVDLIFETKEVRDAVKACADIIVQGWDSKVDFQLEIWLRLLGTWKRQGSSMTVGEFEDGGGDSDCACFGMAASREVWQADKDAVNEWVHPREFYA
jgi:hypothetical protein